jgi:hypothetical protein
MEVGFFYTEMKENLIFTVQYFIFVRFCYTIIERNKRLTNYTKAALEILQLMLVVVVDRFK